MPYIQINNSQVLYLIHVNNNMWLNNGHNDNRSQ